MSYQEKRVLVSVFTGAALLAAYGINAYGKYQAGLTAPEDLKLWAITMLQYIGIGIVAAIVIQIVFHILISVAIAAKASIRNEKCDDEQIKKTIAMEMVEDEMGKLIELKSMRIGFAVAGGGFMIALVTLAMGCTPILMLNLLFAAFSVGSMLEGLTQLYYYRKGV